MQLMKLESAGGRFADGAVPEYLVFDKPNMAEDFIRTVEEGMEKSKTSMKKSPSKSVERVKEKPMVKVQEESVIENDDDIFDEDVVKETAVETASVSEYPENLDAVIRKMFKECTDSDLKASVREVISEYGKLNDVDREGLEKIYDMMK